MTTYVIRNGELVEKSLAYAIDDSKNKPVLGVISDSMEPTRHMADGRYYTSKSKYRATTRAHGCVEVGNETQALLKPRKPIRLDRAQRVEAIKRTIYELRNRK